MSLCRTQFTRPQIQQIAEMVLTAYRWQYIVSGVLDPRFNQILGSMINAAQLKRIQKALAPIMEQEAVAA